MKIEKKAVSNPVQSRPADWTTPGKSVELYLRSVVRLSNLTGAEYFGAFVDVKDVSAVVVRVAAR